MKNYVLKALTFTITFVKVILFLTGSLSAQTQTFNNPALNGMAGNTFNIPTGVTKVTVECWGAGGAGGGCTNNNNNAGGGGGGGTFTLAGNVAVSLPVNITVGAGGLGVSGGNGNPGQTSIFNSTGPVSAVGGTFGSAGVGTSGTGVGGNSTNGITYDGGSGANGVNSSSGASFGGAGGGGAGNGGDGGNALLFTGGAGGLGTVFFGIPGGTGAAGQLLCANGINAGGLAAGGGGAHNTNNGGACTTQLRTGGNGGNGQVVVRYIVITPGSIDACYTTSGMAIAAALAATTVSDDCVGDITKTASISGGPCNATITVTATNGCGSESQTTYTTNINPPPVVFTCGSDVTVTACSDDETVSESWSDFLASTTASGGCNGVLSNDAPADPPSSCGASVAVTWTYTSSCAATSICTRTFTVETSTPPQIVTFASDYTAECDGSGNQSELETWLEDHGGAVAESNCDFSWSNDFESLSDDCGATGSATVTFTVMDDCGNSSTTSATFTIEDTTEPDVSGCDDLPINQFIECIGAEGNEDAADEWNAANIAGLEGCASDLCGNVSVTSDYDWDNHFAQRCGETGSITVTYTITDECENSTSVQKSFIIEDTTAPDVSGCDEASLSSTYECSGAEGNEAAADDWNAANIASLEGCATDLCGSVIVTSDYDFANLINGCGETGTITVTYTLADECRSITTLEGTFTIVDTTAPDVSGCDEASLSDTYECSGAEGNEAAADDWNETNITSLEGCATDLCGEVTVTSDYDFANLVAGCGQTGTITVIYTLTDECENSTTLEGTFTIIDTTDPDVSGCDEASLSDTYECSGAAGNEAAADEWNTANIATLEGCATDLCGDVTVTSDYDFANLVAGCGETGTITVTYTLTDECENFTTFEGTFTIIDTTDPDVSGCDEASLSDTYECSGAEGNEAAADDWNAANIANLEGCATDLCGDVTVTSDFDFANLVAGCGETGTITVTYTMTDECENSTTLEGTFTIIDTTDPDVSGCDESSLSDTYECSGAEGNEAAADEWNTANIESLEGCASDLCGDVSVTSDYDFANLVSGCGETGTITVTYTLTDECENSTTLEGTFTIIDTTDPDVSGCDEESLSDTYECSGAEGNEAAADEWNAANIESLEGCASDLCGDVSVTSDYDFANLEAGCGMTGTITVTYTMTDECENSTTLEGTFTIEDTTPPSFDPEASGNTVECDGSGNATDLQEWLDDNGGALASDACGGVTWGNDFSELSDDCGATGSATVTFSATDDCGNTSYTTATFTIEDNTPPVALCHDVVIDLDDIGNISIGPDDIDNGSYDECGEVTLSVSPDNLECPIGAIVTLTVTDECGNTATCTATVTVDIPELVSCGNNNDKVLICHIPPGHPENLHTICIDVTSLCDHLAHGDYIGACGEAIANPNNPGSGSIDNDQIEVSNDHVEKVSISEPNVTVSQTTKSVNHFIYSQPNPFDNQTTIHVGLDVKENVSLRVFNNMGQLVTTLVEGTLEAGEYSFVFDASNLSDGLYFYSLTTGKVVESERLILAR